MIPRVFGSLVQEMLSVFPVVALVGPRQVGKSTLVTSEPINVDRRYLSMDSIVDRTFAESDPTGALDSTLPITIDEIQLVPALLREIKRLVDSDRKPGRFLITGSADLTYAADLAHVLAGRVGIVDLPPLTNYELWLNAIGFGSAQSIPYQPSWVAFVAGGPEAIHSGRTAEPLPSDGRSPWDSLAIGGFPLSVTAPSDRARDLWFESFRTTYLERDLRRLSDVGSISGFARLMELTAARTATLLNQAALSREIGLPAPTTGRYLGLLEASLLIRRVPGWYANIGKRIVKSPKLFWRDTGIAANLMGLKSEAIERHPLRGPLFETMVMQEISALSPVFLHGARVYHLRTHDGLEIDALIHHHNQLVPIEIKGRRTASAEDARPIERWLDLSCGSTPSPAAWGAVMYAGEKLQQLSRRVWAVPIV